MIRFKIDVLAALKKNGKQFVHPVGLSAVRYIRSGSDRKKRKKVFKKSLKKYWHAF